MSKEKVIAAMKEVFKDVPYGIEHTLTVLTDAETIMEGEGIDGVERELISVVALLHDIGALEAQRKYGSMEGMYQEQEGPAIAERILKELNYDPKFIERVCFIIGHHHTPTKIDGIDFQIQWEADFRLPTSITQPMHTFARPPQIATEPPAIVRLQTTRIVHNP